MRVIIFMLTTTYGESVNSTPNAEIGEPSGPIENGTTYIVRPRIQPLKTLRRVSFISDGSTQLLVGPASSSLIEQMNVLSSTRATSFGFERAKNELGRSSGFSRMNVPFSTRSSANSFHSSSEPSHHCTRSG